MANQWLVSNLIRKLKLRQLIVTADDAAEGFGVSDYLDMIDDVIRSKIVPILKRTREDYLIAREDMDLESGRSVYPLPSRAAAESLKAILYDAGDDLWPPLERVTEEKANEYVGNADAEGRPCAYYLQDDSVVFVPTPTSDDLTVRFLRFNRPNRLVDADEVGQITSINTGTGAVTIKTVDDDGEFTVAAAPTAFTSSVTYDLVRGTPGFRCRAIDLSATVASNVLDFDTLDIPDGLEVGDFVCLAGETPIAQIPAELHPLLAQEVGRILLEAKGDKRADRAEKTSEKMQADAESMLSNRVQAAPKYIRNKNAPGYSRLPMWWRR